MRIDRIISMIMLLLKRDAINAAELAKIFGVSVRTIYRDAEAIEKAGIPIIASTGPAGGLSVSKRYKIDKQLFTDEDIASLIISMNGAKVSFVESARATVMAKLKGMVSREQFTGAEDRTGQFTDQIPTIAVKIEFDGSVKDKIAAFGGDTFEEAESGGRWTALIYVEDNEIGYNTLFQLPNECVCVAPDHVRGYLTGKIDLLHRMYGERFA